MIFVVSRKLKVKQFEGSGNIIRTVNRLKVDLMSSMSLARLSMCIFVAARRTFPKSF